MAKTLIQKLTNGAKRTAATALIPLMIACQTLPVRKFPDKHISGVKYQTIDQSAVPYKLEEQVIYGERYYLQERDKISETLPITFLPFSKVTRELDLDSNK